MLRRNTHSLHGPAVCAACEPSIYRLGRYATLARTWTNAKKSLKGCIVAVPFFFKSYPRHVQAPVMPALEQPHMK